MSPRVKRMLASLVVVVYMLGFIALAAVGLPLVGGNKWAMGLITLVAGITWTAPLIPFLRWASRPAPAPSHELSNPGSSKPGPSKPGP